MKKKHTQQSVPRRNPIEVTRFDLLTVVGVALLLLALTYYLDGRKTTLPQTEVVKPLPISRTIDCKTLKTIYEEAYIEALHPITDSVDWDALDIVFYTKHKECT